MSHDSITIYSHCPSKPKSCGNPWLLPTWKPLLGMEWLLHLGYVPNSFTLLVILPAQQKPTVAPKFSWWPQSSLGGPQILGSEQFCHDVISYFSLALMKHYSQKQLTEGRVSLGLQFQRESLKRRGKHGSRWSELEAECSCLHPMQEATAKLKVGQGYESPSPGTHFPQQGSTTSPSIVTN